MDVVLHYRRETADLSNFVSKTERALEDFPCRVLPVFTPWYPSVQDRILPIKALRSPPIISLEEVVKIQSHILSLELELQEPAHQSFDIDESPQNGAQTSLVRAVTHAQTCPETGLPPAQFKDGALLDSKGKRSWSIFSQTQKGCPRRTVHNIQTFSRQFHRIVWSHRLHMHQRAKWVIKGQNCVVGDLEQAWKRVNHAIKNSKLPTCNANIQRSRGQIWVFCDVLQSEHVGKYLKEELQLTGKITLSVHRLGEIMSF